MRLIRTTANGQPAGAMYMLNRETGVHEPFQMHVLAVSRDGISHVVAFHMDVIREVGPAGHALGFARCALAIPLLALFVVSRSSRVSAHNAAY